MNGIRFNHRIYDVQFWPKRGEECAFIPFRNRKPVPDWCTHLVGVSTRRITPVEGVQYYALDGSQFIQEDGYLSAEGERVLSIEAIKLFEEEYPHDKV